MASRWCPVLPFLALALLAAAAGFGIPAARLHAESANSDFKQGQAAETREDYDAAFELYQKAYTRDPKDTRFRIALTRIRVTASSVHITKGRKLFATGDLQGALSEFLHASEIDPAWLEGKTRIGVTAGASAPEVLVQVVTQRLKEFGAKSVRVLEGVEEHVTFPLPKGLTGTQRKQS